MRKYIVIPVILSGIVLISFTQMHPNVGSNRRSTADSLADERKKIVLRLADSLKDKLNVAADSVFRNLQLFDSNHRLPVKHLLGVMSYWGYALGVNCTYCHNTANWASDSLKTKKIAREMYNMRQTINDQILAKMPNIDPKLAQVNCTTCHNGNVAPRK